MVIDAGTGLTGTTLKVTFDSDPSTSYPVSLENPSFQVQVPAGAIRLLVEDESGVSDDFSAACEDPAGVSM